MDHADHVRLIRAGLTDAGPRWLELGAGDGAFTLALVDVLGPTADITALDRDPGALRRLAEAMRPHDHLAALTTITADFRETLPAGPFDGVLAANSLHFAGDPVAILRAAGEALAPGGRLIVVEYDADRGNRWVPHPFSARRFAALAASAGFIGATEIGRVPSRFLRAIYAAIAWPGPGPREPTGQDTSIGSS